MYLADKKAAPRRTCGNYIIASLIFSGFLTSSNFILLNLVMAVLMQVRALLVCVCVCVFECVCVCVFECVCVCSREREGGS